MELAVLTTYAIVILVNLYFQFDKKFTSRKHSLLFFFSFEYRVFAPKPISTDYCIYYRDLLRDGSSTELSEYQYYNKPKMTASLWRMTPPSHLTIFTYISAIKKHRESGNMDFDVLKSRQYKQIELEVSKLEPYDQTLTRQVVICATAGFGDDKKDIPVIISHISYG